MENKSKLKRNPRAEARGETLLFNLNFAFGAIDDDCLIKVTLFTKPDPFPLLFGAFKIYRAQT